MKDQSNNYRKELQLQPVTQTVKEEHPIVLCFPVEEKEKEYTWPANWSWRDDMVIC
jgi:hypothetical protein